MARCLGISLAVLPIFSISLIAGCLGGCSRQTSTTTNNGTPSAKSSPSASGVNDAKSVIAAAGKKAAKALFDEIGPPPFASVQNVAEGSPAVAEVRSVTLADLPRPAFSFPKVETGGGPGILIFEPVPTAGCEPTLADFAAGCSDWLFFTVGGQPQMGQTPLLTSVSRAQRELKLTQNLRLGLEDARRIAAITGASHVAIGTLVSAGTGKAALTYTLYEAGNGKAVVGKPVTVSGSSESIRTQLPKVAAALTRQLGVDAPLLSTKTDAAVSELSSLGRVFWSEAPPAVDLKVVSAAAPRVALANLCRLTQERYSSGTQFQRDAALLLTKLAPSNTLAWGHAAYMNSAYLTPHVPRLTALRQRYPQNYALAHTDVWMNRKAGTDKGERHAAEDAVRAAPRNPDAWLSLGWTVSEEASKLRDGRFAQNISPDEWRYLHTVYPLWERAVARAVELDPQHEAAWTRLAKAAAFAGHQDVSEDAFWKSEKYGTDKPEVFQWGLQMFQEKWGGRKTDLDRVAQDAAVAEYSDARSAGYIAADLREAGYPSLADSLLKNWMSKVEGRLAENPADPYALWDKGTLLFFMNRKTAACREMAKVTKLLPKSVEAQQAYADTLLGLGADVRSIPEYRRVLELDPQNALAPLKLGSGLKHAEQWDEAEKWYKVAISRLPNSGTAHLALAELYQYYGRRRPAEAAREYARCMELGGDAPVVYVGITFALADSGKSQEAIRWGEEAWAKYGGTLYSEITDRDRVFIRGALGYAYMKSKRYKDALDQGEAALKITPTDPNTHEMLGDTYFALGRRLDARKSWNIVVTSIPEKLDPEGVGHARTMLAKYPENGT